MTVDGTYAGYRGEWGLVGPAPISDGPRISPEEGFFSGPEVGAPLRGFTLKTSARGSLDLHADGGRSKAAVVFFRSAVW